MPSQLVLPGPWPLPSYRSDDWVLGTALGRMNMTVRLPSMPQALLQQFFLVSGRRLSLSNASGFWPGRQPWQPAYGPHRPWHGQHFVGAAFYLPCSETSMVARKGRLSAKQQPSSVHALPCQLPPAGVPTHGANIMSCAV